MSREITVPTPTARLHEVTMAALHREPSAPESVVTIGVTAKRLHTWEITVRGSDPDECDRIARRLDDGLAEEGITSIDFLKIDVEGAELRVMDGAPQALARAERIVMEARIRFLEAVHGHLSALAALERAVGKPLDEER